MAMDFPQLLWNGDITAFIHQDPDPAPNTVLDIDKDWKMNVEWNVSGSNAGFIEGGTWHIMFNIESLGAGGERTLLTVDKPAADTVAGSNWNDMRYSQEVTVLARNPDGIPSLTDRINVPGVYKLVVILTYTDGFQDKPRRLTGFLEGPVLQFYHFEV